MENSKRVRLLVWSDYVCPFCYLELPAITAVRRQYGDAVEVDWRAFELRPEPEPTLEPNGEYLRETWKQAVYPMAEQVGIPIHLPPVQPRSRLALEAAEFARTKGHFDSMHRALFQAFFEKGEDIGQMSVLLSIGEGAGLSRDELRSAVEEGRFTDKVNGDRRLAERLGITGVPASLLVPEKHPVEDGYLVNGAVPEAFLIQAVEQVMALPER